MEEGASSGWACCTRMAGGGGYVRRAAIRATHAETEERQRRGMNRARRPARGDDPPNSVSVWATARRRSPIGSHGRRGWPTRGHGAGVPASSTFWAVTFQILPEHTLKLSYGTINLRNFFFILTVHYSKSEQGHGPQPTSKRTYKS